MTKVIKDLTDTEKYCGTARPFLSISFAISIPLLLVHSKRWFLYGKDSCKASLQKWEDTLVFLFLIMAFAYASATLQSKKGTVKEIRIFSATADAFPSTSLHWKWMILKIQESQKCLKYKVVILLLIIYEEAHRHEWDKGEYLLADQVIVFYVRKYCFSWQVLLLVENWKEMDRLILHWTLLLEEQSTLPVMEPNSLFN